MDVYCVKDRRVTPNVKGTERVVWTKNNANFSKSSVLCVASLKQSFCR